MTRRLSPQAACGLALLLTGCAQSQPAIPIGALRSDPWLIAGLQGYSYTTSHYRICTTLRDPPFLSRFICQMEAAHNEYESQFPAPPLRSGALEIDLLASPEEFATFTTAIAGEDAAAYARVGRGGYTIGERFVCRLDDEGELFSVAAHEGLHQYMARHFKVRLPPTIEEGLATTFENVAISGDSVRFDFTHNPRRSLAAQSAVGSPRWIPLDTLLQMHAGDVAGTGNASETYYGQCWLLARLLSTDPRYRDGFEQFIRDCAAGKISSFRDVDLSPTAYRPAAVWLAMQPYLKCDLPALEHNLKESLSHGSKSD